MSKRNKKSLRESSGEQKEERALEKEAEMVESEEEEGKEQFERENP